MIRSSFPILYVDDLAASLRFYGELLGFRELYRFPPDEEAGFVSMATARARTSSA